MMHMANPEYQKISWGVGRKNAKLKKLQAKMGKVVTFSLRSGYNCPFAKDCFAHVKRDEDGKATIVDGKDTIFRCFSSMQEAVYPAVYDSRESNEFILMIAATCVKTAAEIISVQIPPQTKVVRIHVGGDFKTQSYFDAWVKVAQDNPSINFYAYTKSLPFWVKRLDTIPNNLMLTASRGGRADELIDEHGLREAIVVFYRTNAEAQAKGYNGETAESLGLEIDEDDSIAADPKKRNQSFALLIHGVQPKGSEAGVANEHNNPRHKGKDKRVEMYSNVERFRKNKKALLTLTER